MSNFFQFWIQSQQFCSALRQGKLHRARQLIKQIKDSGARLSLLEQQFYERVLLLDELTEQKKELASIRQAYAQLKGADVSDLFELRGIPRSLKHLQPNPEVIQAMMERLNLEQIDSVMWQCRGIDSTVFDALEKCVFNYLEQKLKPAAKLKIQRAHEEIKNLMNGKDPNYSLPCLDDAYLLEYFLDNIYSSYLAWFFIYTSGLIKSQIKILDVAAGPATVLFGLGTFLETLQNISQISRIKTLPAFHISYHFQEQQKSLQETGQLIWQSFINHQSIASNTFWRIDTSDLFKYSKQKQSHLPEKFYDFIVISHCFFWENKARDEAYEVYSRLCQDHLAPGGYALFIIQQYKFFNLRQSPSSNVLDQNSEGGVIHEFCRRIKLNLVWCKAINSIGVRGKSPDFKTIVNSLPVQAKLTQLRTKFLSGKYTRFPKSYLLDDYLILLRQ